MNPIRYILGIDISTQTIRAILVGVVEEDGRPAELMISGEWAESRPCRDELSRKSPSLWLDTVRDCISGLKSKIAEAGMAESIGVSTTFPGCFNIALDGAVNPDLASLYDNSSDAGVCGGEFEEALGEAESDTVNRMWPGNMAIGLAALVKNGSSLADTGKIVPPNTAFAHELLKLAGFPIAASDLFSDFTETAISGLYDAHTGEPLPAGVRALLGRVMPKVPMDHLFGLLCRTAPSWRNVVSPEAMPAVRELLGLPCLNAVSIGAGDSPLGALALMRDRDTVINVRGSSDSPMIVVDAPRKRSGPRETVLHYPLPTATAMSDSPWCVVAPMLRSGRVWDWVRGLRFAEGGAGADAQLETLALEAMQSARGRLSFDTALGGERAPLWDPHATGMLTGLTEAHTIGDIALAALLDMTQKLASCIRMMEDRYDTKTSNMLLVGGPARNRLWNSITQNYTGKTTFATTFSDASLLGAGLLGYAAAYDGIEPDPAVSRRLMALSRLSSNHPLLAPVPVEQLP